MTARNQDLKEGDRVLYWLGAMQGDASGTATVISGLVGFGRTPCYRIRKDSGGTDYLAATHLSAVHGEEA